MITIYIIIITSTVSLFAMRNRNLFYKLCLYPKLIVQNKQWYRTLSYGLIHADFMHLLVNMLVLYFFGTQVEKNYHYVWGDVGGWLFLLLYVSSLFFSTLADVLKHANNDNYVAVGASGATSAVLFAGILLFPLQKIYIMFVPIGIPAVIFGAFYLIYSAYMDKHGKDNIGHNTHFWGAVYGFVFAIVFKWKLLLAFFVQILQKF